MSHRTPFGGAAIFWHCAGWTLWQRSHLLCPSDNVPNCLFKILTKERPLVQRSLIKGFSVEWASFQKDVLITVGRGDPSHGISAWCERGIVGPALTMWLTSTAEPPVATMQGLPLLFFTCSSTVSSTIQLAEIEQMFPVCCIFSVTKHFQVLSYTAVFLGMVCVGSLNLKELITPWHREKVLGVPVAHFRE